MSLSDLKNKMKKLTLTLQNKEESNLKENKLHADEVALISALQAASVAADAVYNRLKIQRAATNNKPLKKALKEKLKVLEDLDSDLNKAEGEIRFE
jgi:hypothetical protein